MLCRPWHSWKRWTWAHTDARAQAQTLLTVCGGITLNLADNSIQNLDKQQWKTHDCLIDRRYQRTISKFYDKMEKIWKKLHSIDLVTLLWNIVIQVK